MVYRFYFGCNVIGLYASVIHYHFANELSENDLASNLEVLSKLVNTISYWLVFVILVGKPVLKSS